MENIKLKEKIGYGLGDAASSMFWKLFGVYLLFYYTDVVGLPAAAIGTMFLITRIWDTFLDPIVGLMADRTDTRWGKFRPYILWMAVPFGLCGILTFSVPELNQTQGLIYAYVTYTLMMMVYSFINVPYASLLGVISADPKVRTELSSYRMVFAFAGSILVLFLIEPLVAFFGKTKGDGILVDQALGWQMALVFFAAIATFFFLCTFAWTKERIRPMKEESNRFKDDLMDLVCNKPWWILLGAGVAALVFNSMRDGSTIFYFKYYVKDVEAFKFGFIDASVSLTSIYLVLGQAANIIGILFVTPVANKIGRKKTYFVAMVLASIFSVVFYFIDANNILLVMALQVLISICAGSIFPLLWAMYADIADFSEWKTGRRATGLIFSSSSMSQKLGWTIGGALTGWLLAYFGFKSNVQQTEMAQNGIRMMMSFFPAIGALLSAVFISLYSLSEVKLEGITRELNEKRNQIIKDAQ